MATGRAVNGTGLVQYAWVSSFNAEAEVSGGDSGLKLSVSDNINSTTQPKEQKYLKLMYSRRFTAASLLRQSKNYEGIEISITKLDWLEELLELLSSIKKENSALDLGIIFVSSGPSSPQIKQMAECPALTYFCIKSTSTHGSSDTSDLQHNSILTEHFMVPPDKSSVFIRRKPAAKNRGGFWGSYTNKSTTNLLQHRHLTPNAATITTNSDIGSSTATSGLKRASRSFTSFIIPSTDFMSAPLHYDLPSDLDLDKFIPDDKPPDSISEQLINDPDYMLKLAVSVLVCTWFAFIIIMGQLIGVWDYLFNKHQVITSYEDFEDTTGFPIPGYYLNLTLLMPVILWIWCISSWVGMKFFRHSKGGSDPINVD